jgi:flavin reductase (DIM6/NTAB) family NADH-FMN oxidoreductase RutF
MTSEADVPAADLDAFVAGLNYSMLLVTTRHGDLRSGCLVGFGTQTSIDPFRYLLCLSRSNTTTRVAARAEALILHQIGPDQHDLARLFGEESAEWTDKFASCACSDGPLGLPVLDGCPAWFAGRVVEWLELGDHAGALLAPIAASRVRPGLGLTFADLPHLEPGQEA